LNLLKLHFEGKSLLFKELFFVLGIIKGMSYGKIVRSLTATANSNVPINASLRCMDGMDLWETTWI